jgi:hypothetical protein
MFFIRNLEIGQFGNKLLYINNLIQISHKYKSNYALPRFKHDIIFDFESISSPVSNYRDVSLTDISNGNFDYDENIDYNLTPCLGDGFFQYDTLNTTEIFKLKSNFLTPPEDGFIVSIHFRGNDFYLWDPKSILSFDYYVNSIQHVLETYKNIKFKLFTDDLKLISYTKVKNYFDQNNIVYELGKSTDPISDFVKMSYSDLIISSPSTFCICAGFIGKEDKKIIHSEEWVKYQCDNNSKFWVDFNNGGNKNYKKYKLI